MFYSQFILAKKGPLGTIWIAAHLERKLRKNQVAETDIGVTVDSILFPEVPIALRLSGHLLLGVVRIYSRQVNYLFNDCSETLGKIKQAFHAADVDLPPEATTAPFHTITLPETFDFDELELVPDSESSFLHLNGNYVDQHVTTREQITLQDTVDHNPYLGSSQFGLDERFDDGSYFSLGLDFDEEFLADKAGSSAGASTSVPLPKEDTTVPPSGNESTFTPLLMEDAAGLSINSESEVTPMEIDDHCEPVKPGCHEIDPIGQRSKAVVSFSEGDNHPSTSVQGITVDPNISVQAIAVDRLIEHADSQANLRKELDFVNSKQDTPGFHAYTPRALEACTPDLNQEYCPPDEPSTPALVDETSLPMYKEFTVENAGRFSPAFMGHSERTAAPETHHGSLAPHPVQNPWASSTNEAIRSPSSASFQGFTLHQAAPVDEMNGITSTQFGNAQTCLVKENAAPVNSVMENALLSSIKENAGAVSTAFPSFPQQACLQHGRIDVQSEGPNFKESAAAVSTAFPSFPQQACLQQGMIDVRSEGPNFKESAAAVSTAFPSFPHQACLQQGRTDVPHEGPKFKENVAAVSAAFSSFPQQVCLQQGRTDVLQEGPKLKENAAAVSTAVPSFPQQARLLQGRTDVPYDGPKFKENAASVSAAFPSFPQQACLQQVRTDVPQEGPKFKENAGAVSATLSSFPQQACLQQGRTDAPHEGVNEGLKFKENEAAASTAVPSFLQQACLQQGRTDVCREALNEGLKNAAAVTSIMENAQVSPVKGNAAALSTAAPSFPQQACLQQGRSDVRFEGPKFPADASDSFTMSSGTYLPQSVGFSSTFVNSQGVNTSLNQAVSAPFQQRSLSVSPYSPHILAGVGTEPQGFKPPSTLLTTTVGQYDSQTLVGVETEPPSFQPPSTLSNTMTGGQGSMASSASPTCINPSLFASTTMASGQGSMASFASPTCINPSLFASTTATGGQGSFASPTCINPSLFASTGSYPPMGHFPPPRHVEHMSMDKNLAASKDSLWQPAAQQCNPSSFVVNAPLMSPRGMQECETLRSAFNLQDRGADFSSLQQGMSHDRMPGLELDRNKFCSPSVEGATRELLLPELYRTPVLRNETPFAVARTSVLSTPTLNSVPGDDDVLASILGRRTKTFKVVSTPKVEKLPKVSAASKRPKSVSRTTPKRRKVELDTVAVLHGDIIRQQLASTEDIHRERRKAPCTRREVWGFLRECEGQENFDEPTLPELSSDLLELYHDVLHGRESRPLSLSGATEVKEACLEAAKDDCSELDNVEDTDLLAHYVKRLSAKDACPSQAVGITQDCLPQNIAEQVSTAEGLCSNQAVGNVENGLLEKCLERPKEDREEETAAQQNLFMGLMGAGDAETLRAEEPSVLEVGTEVSMLEGCTEVLDGKEGQAFSGPEAHVVEEASSQGVTETRTEGQGARASDLERELDTLLVSGFQEGVPSKQVADQGATVVWQQDTVGTEEQNQPSVSGFQEGVPSKQVADQGATVVLQQDTVGTEEQNQPSVGVEDHTSYEGQIVLSSEDANLQALCIPSGGKDAAEMPESQAAGIDIGNAEEGEDKTTASVVVEEETHQHRNDEEMAVAEPERDTDCFDEDNDVPYAEIDYSSDEQDVPHEDDSGWSTRSRNVGKYLKTVFQDMESNSRRLDQGATLGLERLLARRTRREAARMFFETLVLKTKDYIHVEQNVAYQDILLYPNSKLMKTEF